MKVSKLVEYFQSMNPDEDIIVLWWEKFTFDYSEDDELAITQQGWERVCAEFDEWDEAGAEVTDWIQQAVLDHAEVRPYD